MIDIRLLSVGIALPLLAHAAPRVELRVADSAGAARSGEVVVSGIPFAAKTLAPDTPLRVETADGRGVPTQHRVLGTWPDGSVKWMLVQFPATVAAGAAAKYFLTAGTAPAPAHPVGIEETPAAVRVDTGALQVAISKLRLELPGAVQDRRGRPLTGSSVRFELADGTVHESPAAGPPSVVVEDRGPVRATIKVTGWLSGPGGERWYRIESRLRFFAGRADVVGDHTFTVLGGPRLHEIRRISYRMETPGNRVAVAVRDFAHLGPNGIETSPGRVSIDVWSPRDGQILRFGRGRAKTHHVLYGFSGEKSADLERAVQQPPMATTTPEYMCATGALGTLSPSGAPETQEYDRKIAITFESLLQARNTDPRESGMQHFGDYYHGGYGNKLTRGNLEYDTAHALFLLYARSGDRRYYDYAVQCNQHFIDLDVNHETGDQLFHGYGANAETHEEITTRLEWGHIFTDGPADAWFLTGDERSLEALRGIADRTASIADGGFEKIRRIMAGAERQVGWPLLALCRAYAATRDAKYLAAARTVVDYIKLYAADPAAEYRTGRWWRSWMAEGCKAFMVGALHEGLGAYYGITADRSLVPVIRKSLDWLIEYLWDPASRAFIYEYNAMNRGHRLIDPSLNMMVVDAFRSGYEITGDPRYLAVAMHTFWSRVDAMKAPIDAKYFTIDTRTSPHTAAFFARKKLNGNSLPAPPRPSRSPATVSREARPRAEVLVKARFDGTLACEDGGEGAFEGKISYTDGHRGKGLALTEAGHAWLPVPADLLHSPGTIELWLRLNRKRTNANPAPEAIFQIEGERPLIGSLGLSAVYHELRVRMTGDTGTLNGTAEAGISSWEPGQWHHVAVTWSPRHVRLFIDGKEQRRPDDGKVLWDLPEGLPAVPQTRIHLGWRPGNWYADAAVDDLVIHGRELPSQEIQARAVAASGGDGSGGEGGVRRHERD